ncbi:mucin TcMUCI [Trypanosoma cruzi cruzi]|nr:mucin TcMUCI [Trypanosoma cruzi cruzi]PWV01035.1 putative mucin TcMUCI [Trypanosoma cruzi]
MMMCRLLCALLVLALCCFPSVCAAESEEAQVSTLGEHSVPTKDRKEDAVENDVLVARHSSTSSELGLQPSVPSGPVPVSEHRKDVGKGQSSTVPDPQSNDAGNALPKEDKKGGTGTQIHMDLSTEQTDKEAEASAKTTTTTTTTKAPTTTTTTTTQAPSTTTTEAPTTSNTRAPSRLREIDGSLSSSAWVCAPLLLAVSALAYTTLG